MTKIGITGTHGVGKTTLCRSLAYHGYPKIIPEGYIGVIDETVREVAMFLGIDSATNLPRNMVDILQMSSLVEQIKQEAARNNFISDRTVIDYLAYSYWRECSIEVLRVMERIVYRHISGAYDVLIYCPIPVQNELLDDGFRLMDDNSQQEIDDIIRDVIQSMFEANALDANKILVELGEDRDNWFDEAMDGIRTRI